MEQPSTMAPPTEPPSTMAPPTLAPEDAACLQAHNAKRALHGSQPLAWSDVLAQHAQAWADHLAATETFVHEQGIDEGENLYFVRASTTRSCSDAVESWYSEELLYDYDRPPQTIQEFLESDIGHFTQIVWNGTTMVGAGIATVVGGRPPIQTYIVARYAPPGNVLGRFTENVMRPVVPI
ncbi:ectin-like [Orbicella faveolata]|nr:ectin-like [Orbicella faveolata]